MAKGEQRSNKEKKKPKQEKPKGAPKSPLSAGNGGAAAQPKSRG